MRKEGSFWTVILTENGTRSTMKISKCTWTKARNADSVHLAMVQPEDLLKSEITKAIEAAGVAVASESG